MTSTPASVRCCALSQGRWANADSGSADQPSSALRRVGEPLLLLDVLDRQPSKVSGIIHNQELSIRCSWVGFGALSVVHWSRDEVRGHYITIRRMGLAENASLDS